MFAGGSVEANLLFWTGMHLIQLTRGGLNSLRHLVNLLTSQHFCKVLCTLKPSPLKSEGRLAFPKRMELRGKSTNSKHLDATEGRGGQDPSKTMFCKLKPKPPRQV